MNEDALEPVGAGLAALVPVRNTGDARRNADRAAGGGQEHAQARAARVVPIRRSR